MQAKTKILDFSFSLANEKSNENANEKSLRWNVMMWCKYAVCFSFKSPSKFKFDLNFKWILLHNSSYFPYSSFTLWNIWLNYFCPFWFLINTTNNWGFFTKSQKNVLLHAYKFYGILCLSWETRIVQQGTTRQGWNWGRITHENYWEIYTNITGYYSSADK